MSRAVFLTNSPLACTAWTPHHGSLPKVNPAQYFIFYVNCFVFKQILFCIQNKNNQTINMYNS